MSRTRARHSRFFVTVEPLLRILATHVSRMPLATKRAQIDKALVAGGELRGLSPDEFIVLSAVSALCSGCAAIYFISETSSMLVPLVCVAMGPYLPWLHLRSLIKARHRSVQPGLPGEPKSLLPPPLPGSNRS